jgi:hypothetical protein
MSAAGYITSVAILVLLAALPVGMFIHKAWTDASFRFGIGEFVAWLGELFRRNP